MSLPYFGLPSVYLGAYWGNRTESNEQCAQRMARFAQRLSSIDVAYTYWSVDGNAIEARNAIEICALLDSAPQGSTISGSNVGSGLFLSNSALPSRVDGKLSFHCGCDANTQYTRIPNNVVIYFPDEGESALRFSLDSVIRNILYAVIEAWQPDWAVVTSRICRDYMSPALELQPFLGWMTWIPVAIQNIPQLPMPCQTYPVYGGTLIQALQHTPDCTRGADAAIMKLISARLLAAGLLGNADYSKQRG